MHIIRRRILPRHVCHRTCSKLLLLRMERLLLLLLGQGLGLCHTVDKKIRIAFTKWPFATDDASPAILLSDYRASLAVEMFATPQ